MVVHLRIRLRTHYSVSLFQLCCGLIRNHGADRLALMHQLEGFVDPLQRQLVRDEVVDVDLAVHVPIDDFGHVAPAFGAAESGAFPGAAGDQLEGAGRDFLARGGNADNHAGAPSALAAFQRLAHQLDVAHAFEGEIRAAAGQVDQVGYEVTLYLAGIDEMGHAEFLGDRLARRVQIDADDHARPGDARALDHVEADSAQPEHNYPIANLDLGGVDHGADSGGDAAADVADFVERGVLAHPRQGDFRDYRVIGEGRRAHVMMDHFPAQ